MSFLDRIFGHHHRGYPGGYPGGFPGGVPGIGCAGGEAAQIANELNMGDTNDAFQQLSCELNSCSSPMAKMSLVNNIEAYQRMQPCGVDHLIVQPIGTPGYCNQEQVAIASPQGTIPVGVIQEGPCMPQAPGYNPGCSPFGANMLAYNQEVVPYRTSMLGMRPGYGLGGCEATLGAAALGFGLGFGLEALLGRRHGYNHYGYNNRYGGYGGGGFGGYNRFGFGRGGWC